MRPPHRGGTPWVAAGRAHSNYRINLQFQLIGGDWMRPYVVDVPPLLDEAGVRVLIYAGDADFICNWYGNKAWAERLDWSGKEGFNAAQDVQWIANGDLAGEAKTYGCGPRTQRRRALAIPRQRWLMATTPGGAGRGETGAARSTLPLATSPSSASTRRATWYGAARPGRLAFWSPPGSRFSC